MKTSHRLRLCISGAVSFFINNHVLSIVLPLYIHYQGGSAVDVGLMAGLMSLLSTVTRPYIGALLDARGRRVPILVAALLLGLTSVSYIWTNSTLSILSLRALQGACFAVIASGYLTLIGDLSVHGDEGQLFSYAGLAMPISLLVSPVLTEYLVSLSNGFDSSFVVAGVAATTGLISFNAVTKGTQPSTKIPNNLRIKGGDDASQPDEGERKHIWAAVGAVYLGITDTAVLTFIPVYALQLGLPFSVFLSIFALGMIPLQLGLGSVISSFGSQKVNATGLGALGLALILVSTNRTLLGLALAALLFALGFGSVETSFNVMAVSRRSSSGTGRSIGQLHFFVNAGRTLGSVALGYAAEAFGYGLTFSFAGLCAAIPVAVKWLTSNQGVLGNGRDRDGR